MGSRHADRVRFAVSAGSRLSFAIGCLIAACREVPRHHEGRISLASHTLSIAILVPMAAILLMHTGSIGHSANAYGVVDHAGSQNPFLAEGQLAAAPALLLLWLTLGAAHLRLAWVLPERDWSRVFNVSAMIVAGTATLAIYTSVLFIYDARVALFAVATAFELAAVSALAWWHDRPSAPQESA